MLSSSAASASHVSAKARSCCRSCSFVAVSASLWQFSACLRHSLGLPGMANPIPHRMEGRYQKKPLNPLGAILQRAVSGVPRPPLS